MVFGFPIFDLVMLYLLAPLLAVKNRVVLFVWQSMSWERFFTDGFAVPLQVVKKRVALDAFIFR